MGLDQYAVTLPRAPNALVDFETGTEEAELHYWRKHPNLHGWMERLYLRKGGRDPDFNFSPVLLDADDIDQLETAIRTKRLPHTEGFFFGKSRPEEHDLCFIAKARAAMRRGAAVVYYASW